MAPNQVKCGSCNEIHTNFVTVNMHVRPTQPWYLPNHSELNLKGRSSMSCRVREVAHTPPYTADDAPHFAPLITLDCRGLEFTGFDPQGMWECKGAESGTKFGEIELGEGEWTDYDEKAKQSVSIMEIESKWDRAQ
ncbi:DUF866-domain-containing protein [Calocera cornea HHB12733]|uniref:DUF866-domain-containing protein n=1 Tax=Calocera cornea HHB12733 TaxID=1353952 RepID=A0A165J353_9BASI|nr:DUF866-domain-containing protein [Calocera cornea HHB12733]